MSSDSVFMFLAGTLVLAMGLSFHYQSLPLILIIFGGGAMFVGLMDGMLKYLDGGKS